MPTHYETLGVDKTATSDEIKRAYRKLASQHHPDRGGETARFQEIQAAYDTLIDNEKRQLYDHEQANPFARGFAGGNFHGADPFDHLRNMFGFDTNEFFRQHGSHRKNRNLRIIIELNLEDLLQPGFKLIEITGPSGKKTIRIDIPMGVRHGQTLKYSGLGDQSNPNIPPGDLLAEVVIRPHPNFRVMDFDLVSDITIDCLDAMTGTDVVVTGLDRKELAFTIHPGTAPGTKYNLRGQGLPLPNSNLRGDLIIVVNLSVKKLEGHLLKSVNELKQKINENRS